MNKYKIHWTDGFVCIVYAVCETDARCKADYIHPGQPILYVEYIL